jgi:hypothetical protein
MLRHQAIEVPFPRAARFILAKLKCLKTRQSAHTRHRPQVGHYFKRISRGMGFALVTGLTELKGDAMVTKTIFVLLAFSLSAAQAGELKHVVCRDGEVERESTTHTSGGGLFGSRTHTSSRYVARTVYDGFFWVNEQKAEGDAMVITGVTAPMREQVYINHRESTLVSKTGHQWPRDSRCENDVMVQIKRGADKGTILRCLSAKISAVESTPEKIAELLSEKTNEQTPPYCIHVEFN